MEIAEEELIEKVKPPLLTLLDMSFVADMKFSIAGIYWTVNLYFIRVHSLIHLHTEEEVE